MATRKYLKTLSLATVAVLALVSAARTYIPKADGTDRPLSILCLEVFWRPSTRRTSLAFPTGSVRGAASTMRWTHSTPGFTGSK